MGLVVDSIHDFSNAFERLNEEEYKNMVANARKISKQLRSGYYLKQVLKEMSVE